MKTILFFFLITLSFSNSFGQQNWNLPDHYIPSTPYAIHFENSNDGWTVGDFGSILRTTDGGVHWTKQNSGTDMALFSVEFLNTNDGYAGGVFGIFLSTHDSGNSWSVDTIGENSIHKVLFQDSLTGWIGEDAAIYRTIDGGAVWDTSYFDYNMSIYDIDFVTSTEGWAVGMYYDSGFGALILHTTDGGLTWTEQSSPIDQQINSVEFISAMVGYAVTNTGDILKTTDAGNNWIEISTDPYYTLKDILFLNSNDGIAVGDYGLVLKTTDSGTTWTQMEPGINQSLVALCNVSDSVWATGTGRIILSTDSGDTWNTLLSTTSYPLSAADFINDTIGWAAGFYGTLMKTEDGGQSWNLQNSFSPTWFNDLEFYNESIGYIVGNGGKCYLTVDGGLSWDQQFLGTTEQLLSVNYRPDSIAFAVGNNTIVNLTTGDINSLFTDTHRSVFFIDTTYGWISGDQGEILQTTDGGNTWNSQNTDPTYSLMAVFFVNQNTGWAVGTGGTILKTVDSGVTWNSQSSPVINDLSAVYFISENIGWVIGSYGVILFTNDGGETWIQEPYTTSTNLISINFFENTKGIITGENGVILLADCTSSILELTDFSSPSDINICNGSITLAASEETGMITSSFNGGSPVSFSGNWTIENQCPGIYAVSTVYGCGLTQSTTVVIPIDSSYLLNNPFIDSLALDSLGISLENCDIYYAGIDTAYIDSIWTNGNTVTVIWNIIDVNGSNLDTASYDLNYGSGVYWLQLSVFCPIKSINDYFAVTEAVYFGDPSPSSAGISNWEENNITLYPNPTDDLVTISFNENDAQLTIFDAQGKLIRTSTIVSGQQVSLHDVQTGVYFFELVTDKGNVVKRVVKN